MNFTRVLKEVLWSLVTEGSISYRRIKRGFDLDDDALEDLRRELIDTLGVAADRDSEFLYWAPDGRSTRLPAGALSEASPASRRPARLPLPAEAAEPRLPGAERRNLTVMFCDLADSTTLSTQLDPEDMGEIVRGYQDMVGEAVAPFDGFIAKFMGDGVFIYFGYPHAQEKDGVRAVRAGIAILDAVPALNEAMRHITNARLAVRIGIATGLVVVGETIGQGASREQMVVGETPNLAARLQSLAPPDAIMICPTTHDLVGDVVDCEDRGAHVLKGIADPVPVWRVLRLRGVEFESTSQDFLLVGRDEETGLLHRAWQQTKGDGHGQVVLVNGEAGIGKSALIATLRRIVRDEGAARITFRCSPYHKNSALYPIVEHWKHFAAWQPEDDNATRLAKLEASLAPFRLPREETVPLFASLLSLPAGDLWQPLNLTPEQLREQTGDALIALALEGAEQQPIVQIWEDLHWADPSTLDLLGQLIEQVPTVPLLIVLTFRPEFVPPWPARSHARTLTLNRLERAQIEAMTLRLAGGKALPAEVVEHVVQKTDGVPLFVEEMTKAVLGSDVLRVEGDRYILTGPLSEISIPASLQESLMARLDRLHHVREVAQLGAVLGREFTYDMLRAMTPLAEALLRDALGHLVEAELLYQRGRVPRSRYFFKHALIQDTAYQSLLRRTRQQHHRKVAELFESHDPGTVESSPEVIAHHYSEAAMPAEAVGFWQKAGERALHLSANQEAIGHLTAALAQLGQLPDTQDRARRELGLQRLLGQASFATKGYGSPEAIRAFERAKVLGRMVDDPASIGPVLFGAWLFALAAADHMKALATANELLDQAKRTADAAIFKAGNGAAVATGVLIGRLTWARQCCDQGIESFRGSTDAEAAHFAYDYGIEAVMAHRTYGALCYWLLGYPDQASRLADEALVVTDRIGHAFSRSRGLYVNTVFHSLRRDWQATEACAEATITAAREHGHAMVVAAAEILRLAARAMMIPTDDPVAAIRDARAAYLATGARFHGTYQLLLLAQVLAARGRDREALTVLDEAAAMAEETDERFVEAEIHRLQGNIVLAESGPEAAEACYLAALKVARAQEARSLELRAARDLASLWADRGKRARAVDLLAPIHGWFTEGFQTADLREARAVLDKLNEPAIAADE